MNSEGSTPIIPKWDPAHRARKRLRPWYGMSALNQDKRSRQRHMHKSRAGITTLEEDALNGYEVVLRPRAHAGRVVQMRNSCGNLLQ